MFKIYEMSDEKLYFQYRTKDKDGEMKKERGIKE